jgi:FlaG/FlaF family flagellin (archaellin)
MQLRALFRDEDAVSPVIAIVLVVAITAILAAVVGSFALDMGSSQEVTPTATFSFDYSENADGDTTDGEGVLTVRHDSGDPVRQTALYVRGSGVSGLATPGSAAPAMASTGQWQGEATATVDDEPGVTAGNSVTVAVDSAYEVRVNYESGETDRSAVLGEDAGPDA